MLHRLHALSDPPSSLITQLMYLVMLALIRHTPLAQHAEQAPSFLHLHDAVRGPLMPTMAGEFLFHAVPVTRAAARLAACPIRHWIRMSEIQSSNAAAASRAVQLVIFVVWECVGCADVLLTLFKRFQRGRLCLICRLTGCLLPNAGNAAVVRARPMQHHDLDAGACTR